MTVYLVILNPFFHRESENGCFCDLDNLHVWYFIDLILLVMVALQTRRGIRRLGKEGRGYYNVRVPTFLPAITE